MVNLVEIDVMPTIEDRSHLNLQNSLKFSAAIIIRFGRNLKSTIALNSLLFMANTLNFHLEGLRILVH